MAGIDQFIDEVMVQPESTLRVNDSLQVAAECLLNRTYSSCPVLALNGEFLGILTDVELMRALILVQGGRKIKSVWDMRRRLQKCPTVQRQATMARVMQKVLNSESQRVAVVDSRNKFLGIIRPKDLLKRLMDELGYSTDLQATWPDPAEVKFEALEAQVRQINGELEMFKKVFEHVPSLFFAFDSKLNLKYANSAGRRELKKLNQSFQRISARQIFHPVSIKKIRRQLELSRYREEVLSRRGFFSLVSPKNREARFEMTVISGFQSDGKAWLTCMGQKVDAEHFLRILHGAYS